MCQWEVQQGRGKPELSGYQFKNRLQSQNITSCCAITGNMNIADIIFFDRKKNDVCDRNSVEDCFPAINCCTTILKKIAQVDSIYVCLHYSTLCNCMKEKQWLNNYTQINWEKMFNHNI
jgi:hypothetical protein